MWRQLIAKMVLRLIIILALVFGLFYFLLNTQEGTDFIYSSVKNYFPADLQVENLRYDRDGTKVEIKSLSVHWQFWPLLQKHLVMDTVTLDGVKIMVKPAQTSNGQKTKFDLRVVLDVLARLNLRQANFNDVQVE